MANHEFLGHTALFTGVAPAVTRQLAGASLIHTYPRGSTIWRVGDFPEALLIVRTGLVKLTRPAPRGRTSLCWLFGARAILGELVLVNGVPYQNTAVAATPSVSVVSIPRALVLNAAHQDPELALNLFRGFGEKFTALHAKIDVLSAGAVEARLAILLVKLYMQFGDELEDGTLRVAVSLSRQELADMVSTSFETAIRVLARWEREGLVTTDGDGFTLGNLSRLEDLGAGVVPKARSGSSEALLETLQ